ncbi:hypothetical protein SB781_38575, partial [Paraburkholderia sp. SIMBA_061]
MPQSGNDAGEDSVEPARENRVMCWLFYFQFARRAVAENGHLKRAAAGQNGVQGEKNFQTVRASREQAQHDGIKRR